MQNDMQNEKQNIEHDLQTTALLGYSEEFVGAPPSLRPSAEADALSAPTKQLKKRSSKIWQKSKNLTNLGQQHTVDIASHYLVTSCDGAIPFNFRIYAF